MTEFLTGWLLPIFAIVIVSILIVAVVGFAIWTAVGIVQKGRRK